MANVPTHQGRHLKRVQTKQRASLIVNLGGHQQRIPCLLLDSTEQGFRVRSDAKVKRGQVLEIILGGDAVRCGVVWVGKAGHEGQFGVETL